jgi:hypothetical protein
MESTQVIRRGDFVASPRFGHRDDFSEGYAVR